MATKHTPKRRKGSGLRYLQMTHDLTLTALAAGDVVQGDFSAVLDGEAWAVWAKGLWSIRNLTLGEGPVSCGFAHSDYTAAEIEECLEAAASWAQADQIANEQRRRKVRRVAVMAHLTGAATGEVVANDGVEIFTKLGWKIEDGQTMATWARNQDGAAPLTVGGALTFSGIIAVRML